MGSFRAVLVCSMAAVLSLSLVSDARAQSIAVLSYGAPGGPVSSPDTRAALEAAARRDGWTVASDAFAAGRARLQAGAVSAQRLRGFQRARQLLREGWRAYVSVEVAFAAARLAEGRRVAERVLDLQGGRVLYAELSLRLGVVLQHLKRVGDAADLFRLARALDPERAVTVAEFAPDMVAAIEKATSAKPAMVSTRLIVEPAGATVEVDGRVLGRAPLTVSLPAGQHVVVARAPGRVPRGRVFAVGGARARLRVGLDRDAVAAALVAGSARLRIGTDEASVRAAATGLVRYGEVDAVLFVAAVWRRGAPALIGQLCRGVAVRCGRVHELRFPEVKAVGRAAAALWSAAVARSPMRRPPTLLSDVRLTRPEPPPGTRVGNNGHKRPWWKHPVVWIGAGAASFAVGAIVLFSRSSGGSPTVVIDPCEFGGC